MARPDIGIFGINMTADPDLMTTVAQRAEALGYESLWTGEHIVLPDPHEAPSPAPPETTMTDTVATLAFLAGRTERIKLGTGIIILPQRRPAVLAKSLASLDRLSGGRLLFGLGVGYIPREFEACDTTMADRGTRTDRYLEAMRALWTTDAVTIDNEYVRFDRITANPKPAQADIHTVVGGHSMAAAKRAVRLGHGWYGYFRDVATAAGDIDRLRAAAEQVERPAHLGELQISITPPPGVGPEAFDAYASLGVDRIIVSVPMHRGADRALAAVDEHAPR
jgi:probable F420-dependent oxidoreductase